jgi:hypothetical protein
MGNSQNKMKGWFYMMNVLTVLFVVFKLTGVIDWSWWWILSPMWIVILMAFIHAILSED